MANRRCVRVIRVRQTMLPSKAGLIGLKKTTAKEFASRGIRCNAVAPGFIRSAMTDVLSDDVKKRIS